MGMEEIKIKEAEISSKLKKAFIYLGDRLTDYYNECGKDNGMSFRFELIKMQDSIDKLSEEFGKISKRVVKNVEGKIDNPALPQRNIKSRSNETE